MVATAECTEYPENLEMNLDWDWCYAIAQAADVMPLYEILTYQMNMKYIKLI